MSDMQVSPEAINNTAATLGGEAGNIHAVAGRLRATVEEVNGHLSTCRNSVDSLVGQGWRGAAADSFHALMVEWQATLNRVNAALQDVGTAVDQIGTGLDGVSNATRQAASTYADTESSIAGSFGSR